ncbi:MAG: AI-2E family transporter [Chitinophagia bacterium]|jgi:predicted PurR-regulated permease PerM|nr:AI-2E family transporter [Chitinophagia bacterium]
MTQFNNQIRQIVLLIIIAFLGFLIFKELYLFLPGLLGALTTYILTRNIFFSLVEKRKWKKGLTAGLFIFIFLALIAGPVYYAVILISPRVSTFFAHTDQLLVGIEAMSAQIKKITGQELFNADNITALKSALTNFIPTFLNSSANILSNLLVMFFVFYFMLSNGRNMEDTVRKFIPLNEDSIAALAQETNHMVKANAIGIPLISIIQGLAAWFGYAIFGIGDALMWGFLTGLFAFFPILGTMMIWVPMVLYMYSQGLTADATKLLIYSLIVTGNVDYLARVTLMKKIGNVHPLITVFGVIVGLQLFGFMGFIFGPLIFSYTIILIKIYANEFVKSYN